MSNQPILTEYLTRKDAAKELGVSPNTLVNWKARRYGPATFRVGKRAYYSRADIARWLDEQFTAAAKSRAAR